MVRTFEYLSSSAADHNHRIIKHNNKQPRRAGNRSLKAELYNIFPRVCFFAQCERNAEDGHIGNFASALGSRISKKKIIEKIEAGWAEPTHQTTSKSMALRRSKSYCDHQEE